MAWASIERVGRGAKPTLVLRHRDLGDASQRAGRGRYYRAANPAWASDFVFDAYANC